jgi:GDP-L-fucose synthase
MFKNVAECRSMFGKMIQVGSGAEYGKSAPLVRVREEEFGKRVPADEYGLCKYECSKYIEKTDGITCLRLFGCFGKYEDYQTRFISNAICRSLSGMPMTIANRNVVFSYLYIDDFAQVVSHFITHEGRHKFYNAVPDETVDLMSIAGMVNEVSGKSLPILLKNPGMGNEYSGSNLRLREEMPSFRFTSVKEGVGRLYSWYESSKAKINAEKLI